MRLFLILITVFFPIALALGGGGGGGGGRSSGNCKYNAYRLGLASINSATVDPSSDGTCAVHEYSLFDFDVDIDFAPAIPYHSSDNPSVTGYGPGCVRTVRPNDEWRNGLYYAIDFRMNLRSCFSGGHYWDERVEFFWLSTVSYSLLAAFFVAVDELP